MQKNIDTIKEFCMKYRRYLGAAVLLVVLIVILCVKCAMTEDKPQGSPKLPETQQSTQGNVPYPTGIALEGELQKNADEELAALISNYYTAYVNADFASLEMLASPITDNEKSFITTFASYYESYQNIDCYSMQASENAYFVSVCYDLKFYDIDTLAPGMDFFYVERDGKGKLYINNAYTSYNFNFMEQELDANIYAMILAYEQLSEVTALQQEVQARYDEAVVSDEKLANMVGGTLRNAITQWRASVTETTPSTENAAGADTQAPENSETQDEGTSENPAESEKPDESEQGGSDSNGTPGGADAPAKVRTKDICNIRAEASTDAEVVGQAGKGAELTVIATEGNWTKVQFSGGEGYIRNDLLEEP